MESYQVAPGSMNGGDWAACDDCVAALRANDWNKIIYRAVKTRLPTPPSRDGWSAPDRRLKM